MRTIHFMRLHYLHLLPFSFIVFVSMLLVSYSAKFSIKLSLLIFILINSPLLFSFAFYVSNCERNKDKKFHYFIEIYKEIVQFLKLQFSKYLVFILLLLPLLISLNCELEPFGFDLRLFQNAIKSGVYTPDVSLALTSFFSVTLTLFCYPFIIFPEYFCFFKGVRLAEAYKLSFQLTKRNYFLLLFLVIVQVIVFSIGSFFTCGFLFVLALPFFSILTYYVYDSELNPDKI